MMNIFKKFIDIARMVRVGMPTLRIEVEEAKIISAKTLAEIIASRGVLKDIQDAEFKVFSQFGEDGILEYLIRQVGIPHHAHSFVEFGVESYQESNTRFILQNRNWKGLIIDGSRSYMEQVRQSMLHWRYDLTPVAAFIDVENINQLISDAGFMGEIGILSVDIDGNDYWVWEKIDVVSPIIVVAEYNSIFGSSLPITVPYDPSFVRGRSHYSNLYWGASISALDFLAKRKGYSLVGSNSAGNNVFFIRNDHLGNIRAITPKEAWVESRFRESRTEQGELSFLNGNDRMRVIQELDVVDVRTGKRIALKKLDVFIN